MQETLVQSLGWEDSPGEELSYSLQYSWASLVAQMVKSARNAGDWGSIPGLGRSPGGGSGNPLQDSCQKNLKNSGLRSRGSQGVRHE